MSGPRIAALLVLFTAGCGEAPAPSPPTPTPTPATTAPAVQSIDSPAPAGSMTPNLTRADDGAVYLTWLETRAEGGHRLRFSRLTADAWTPAATIHEGDAFFANWADFPSLIALSDGALLAHWLEKTPGGTYAYDVRYRRSSDGGASWSDPVTLNDDGTASEHGFVSLVPIAGGEAQAIWLDGREMAGGDGGHGETAGAMTLRQATIDSAGRVATTSLLDDRVCECCGTAAVASRDSVLAFYRDRSDDEVRDIAVVRATSADDAPRRLHDDGWRIEGCPVNGPAADADGERIAVAWYTNADERARVQFAFSTDAGTSFTAPLEIAAGNTLGRVSVALLADGGALVAWLEDGAETGTIRARRVTASGQLGAPFTIASTSAARRSGFPQLVRTDTHVVAAWTDASELSQVRTARLDLRTAEAGD